MRLRGFSLPAARALWPHLSPAEQCSATIETPCERIVFALDEKLRAISASRDQIVALHQSLNTPHVAIPGKKAGPVQAFIAGVRGTGGFSVFVYLYLEEVPDCAIYVSSRRSVSLEEYRAEEREAIGFVESMGFMMDTMNFRSLNAESQADLMRTLPMFKRELRAQPAAPRNEPRANEPAGPFARLIGRIFSSF
jgi:hypothetical protein